MKTQWTPERINMRLFGEPLFPRADRAAMLALAFRDAICRAMAGRPIRIFPGHRKLQQSA